MKGQVYWGCRRGMLELDLLLLKFFDLDYSNLSDTEQQLFHQLLNHEDSTLYNWLLVGHETPEDEELVKLIGKIRLVTVHG